VTVVPAAPGDREAVARVLAAAFTDDPVWSWMIPAGGRERRLRRLFGALARHALAGGHAYMTEDRRAVALWSPPDAWKLPTAALLRAAPTVAGAAGHRLPRLVGRLNDIEAHHARQPGGHWYLEFLAVDPSAQGQGLGAALVADALGRRDQPVYLESSNPRNLAFYRRNGFTVAEDLTFRHGPPQWTLWHRRP
jgi:ribosomal protein S18 acetylase RimI-like enzyme